MGGGEGAFPFPIVPSGVPEQNRRILALLSRYLTQNPDFIGADMMGELQSSGLDSETAFGLLLAAGLGLDADGEDKEFYHAYFPPMLHCLSKARYEADPYYRALGAARGRVGNCVLTRESYKPYEAFVCDDIAALPDGRHIPQIGYFPQGFFYPALLEGGRLWMSVTPNEVNTMAAPIARARGRVLTFGLGLGYFACMAAGKPEVECVTAVEVNPNVIALFQEAIRPRLPWGNKVHIVQDDAFTFAQREYPKGVYDFTFTDLWHDVLDGLPLYRRMKALSSLAPRAEHAYWIEKTLLCYL